MNDNELIKAATSSANWNRELSAAILDRMKENAAFAAALTDALNAAGIDIIKAAQRPRLALSVDDVPERETEWIIPGYIPRYQITTLAGDGGSGKTTIECAIIAEVTTGKHCFMTQGIPFVSEPENVLFLSGEDDFTHVLKRKLRVSGADVTRVFTVPISSGMFTRLKFGSQELQDVIEECKPGLVLFDPIQSFVPPDIQMGWRNAMRQCLGSLVSIGENLGASFLITCHTNKQNGLAGRKRIAESADIWDISRSVLMVGDTGEGNIKYLSHEKCNFGELQQTILYELNGERVIYRGRSELKDADYIRSDRVPRPAPARDEAKELIVSILKENQGSMKADDLDKTLKGIGVSSGTMKRAKAELKRDCEIKYSKGGFGVSEWEVSLVQM